MSRVQSLPQHFGQTATNSCYGNAFHWTVLNSLIVLCGVLVKQTRLYVWQLNWLSSRLLEDLFLSGAMKTISDFIIVSIFPFGIIVCFHAVFLLKCTEEPKPVELLTVVQ